MSTPQTVKAQIQSLIDQSNATTGKTDTDLTSAVGSLVEGFGQGGSGGSANEIIAIVNAGIKANCNYQLNTFRNTDIESIDMFDFSPQVYFRSAFERCPKLKSANINISNGNDCSFMFAYNKSLESVKFVGDFSNATNLNAVFYQCHNLKSILTPVNSINSTNNNNFVGDCPSLVDITFVSQSIKKFINFPQSSLLSDASIQSIIDGLADLTGQTAQTLTLHSTVSGKLTETQIETIWLKNWEVK